MLSVVQLFLTDFIVNQKIIKKINFWLSVVRILGV
jgi:hypothetical protein